LPLGIVAIKKKSEKNPTIRKFSKKKMRRKEKHVIRKESSSVVIRKNKKSMPSKK
jgi:di/tripeptidase